MEMLEQLFILLAAGLFILVPFGFRVIRKLLRNRNRNRNLKSPTMSGGSTRSTGISYFVPPSINEGDALELSGPEMGVASEFQRRTKMPDRRAPGAAGIRKLSRLKQAVVWSEILRRPVSERDPSRDA